jgi:hypothetical protein
MNSANGTYVNGKRVGEQRLTEGDEILIGKYSLKFSQAGGVQPSPEPAADQTDMMSEPVHTYVMDGEKIRERLDQMRAAGGPPEAEPPEPPEPSGRIPSTERLPRVSSALPSPAPAAGPGGPAPRRAIDHALDFDPLKPQMKRRPVSSSATQRYRAPGGGASKALLYVSLGTNLVLIILVGVLIVFLFRIMQQLKPTVSAPQPAAATSPAPTPAPAAPEVEPAEPDAPASE